MRVEGDSEFYLYLSPPVLLAVMFCDDVSKHGGHHSDSLHCRQLSSSPSLDMALLASQINNKHFTL